MSRVRTNQGYPVRTEGWGVGGLPFPETEREIISTPDYDIYERGWGVKGRNASCQPNSLSSWFSDKESMIPFSFRPNVGGGSSMVYTNPAHLCITRWQ